MIHQMLNGHPWIHFYNESSLVDVKCFDFFFVKDRESTEVKREKSETAESKRHNAADPY